MYVCVFQSRTAHIPDCMCFGMSMCVCMSVCVHVCVCLILLLASADPRGEHSVHIHEMDTAFSTVWCHTSLTFSLSIGFSNWSHFFTLSSLCSAATWTPLISFGKYSLDLCSRCHLWEKEHHTMSTYLYIFMFQMSAIISCISFLNFSNYSPALWLILKQSSNWNDVEPSDCPSVTPSKFMISNIW